MLFTKTSFLFFPLFRIGVLGTVHVILRILFIIFHRLSFDFDFDFISFLQKIFFVLDIMYESEYCCVIGFFTLTLFFYFFSF